MQTIVSGSGEELKKGQGLSKIPSRLRLLQYRNFQATWKLKVTVAAYWKVVQKRLADEIPLEIRCALQVAIIDELHQNMMSKPWSGAETDLRELMKEDSTGAYDRSRLQLRVDNLKECLHHLNGVMH